MLRSSRGFRIWVCNQATDMRKSFDTLAAIVDQVIGQDPLSGHWFVFVNRRANRMKILCFEGDGYAIWSKRLEAGTFLLPRDRPELTLSELGLVLDGIEWKETARRRRFSLLSRKQLT
jgi:transposase